MNGTLTGYNQAFDNLMVLHNALAENIARHIRMTDNVASTAGEMWKTVREMRLNYHLFLIEQILLYGLIALLIIKEVIT